MIKWLLAVLGFMYMRFPGAILGFIIGTLLDNWNRNSGGFLQSMMGKQESKVSPGDFELNLLSLCALVIKADGKVSQSELDYVRSYFVRAYGKERANATFRTFNDVIKDRQLSASRISQYLASRTQYPTRLQITHFLFGIAQADGTVSSAEANMIQQIASFLKIGAKDFESIKAMFFKQSPENAYKILEIEKSASDAEVKKAYRKMVKKYHPDKLLDMDEAYKKGAREKFDKVQEAYETIQKERGL
ncbi:TerB family tellurite resistance protein [Zunongwangia endophytica]|uniref:TerB family tellurite resistance protein n=1 Tax=Zunongwangia endophytica TaxID=1808945 RepID=A0ABV8H475_9FLAO|nr:TerB family tellurite resistance protein [Zunongwangia endophytica]MDN3595818.1 TerB family tellurite resistance protein [Zunongwangia endophytica]